MEEYTKEFEAICFIVSLHNAYDELYFPSHFVKGIKEEIRGMVQSQVPDIVDRTSLLAHVQQHVLERARLKAPRATNSSKPATFNSKADSKPGSYNPNLWKERQLRDYRRANNLCYFCGEKYDHEHLQKCTKRPKPQLNALIVNDLDLSLSEDTLNQLEIEDVLSQEMLQLSLNAISGTMSGNAMRVRALVQN